MNTFNKISVLAFVLLMIMSACDQGEVKTIESPEVQDPHAKTAETADFHVVSVQEVLYTTNYVYLKVSEGPEQYWIATNKIEVNPGETYMYKGGLLKINFKSKELDREFSKVYFVNKIVGENGHMPKEMAGTTPKENPKAKAAANSDTSPSEITPFEGSISISDIVNNPEKYEGKEVQITAKCVKLNKNIMGRHWMHFQDGSANDYDLIVTADQFVPVDYVVTMTAKVALNQDFGAGYAYDILLENGEVIDSPDY